MSKNYKNNSKWAIHATDFEAGLFTQGFVSEHTILAAVSVGCPSNGRRASLISDLHACGTACSLLLWPAMMPRRLPRPTLLPPLAWPHAINCLLITRKKMI